MSSSKNSGKIIIFALVALIGGAAGFGYFKQSAQLSASDKKPDTELTADEAGVLTAKPNDIILGDNNAILTVVEYSSLSCPHCAHFHEKVLPTIQKEFISTGKVKWVLRHFPLNDPALKGAIIVECAGQNGLKRENFMKVLFDMQAQWAFSENFLKDLKQIALVGGIDSAAFDSCLDDKALETKVLTMRQDAADKLKLQATPSFYIDGKFYTGEPSVEGLRAALKGSDGSAPKVTDTPAPKEAAPTDQKETPPGDN